MEVRSVHSSTSDINSEEAAKTEYLTVIPRKKRICLVGASNENPALSHAAQQFSVPVVKSETGVEYVEDTTYCTYFILTKFEGHEYDLLHKTAHRILGPTALLQLAEKKESLPSINRPLYTQAMLGTIIVFTGFRKKEELTKLVNMIHHMGGSVRREIGQKVTHLIANCCGGEKYRYAVTFSVPIMSVDWVTTLWAMRDNISSVSVSEEMIATFKLKPFFGARVCFFGFPEEEKRHMCEVLQQQGGEATEFNDPNCTHVVIDLSKFCNNKTDKANELLSRSKPSKIDALQQIESIFDADKDKDRDRCKRRSSYSFIYYDPYTNQITNSAKSTSMYETLNNLKRRHSFDESSGSEEFLENDDDSAFCEDISNRTYTLPIREGTRVTFAEIQEEYEEEQKEEEDDKSLLGAMSVEEGSIKSSNDYAVIEELKLKPTPVSTDPVSELTSFGDIDADDDYEDVDDELVTPKNQSQSCQIILDSAKRSTTPRRYVRWRRSSNWNAISKQPKPCSPRLSYPKLVRQYSYRVNSESTIDSLNSSVATDTLSDVSKKSLKTPKALSKAFQHSSALLSKIKEIVIPSILKDLKKGTQYRPGQQEERGRRREDEEAKAARQKYTPIPSPMPVPKKLARFNSNSMRSSRTTQLQHQQQRRQRKIRQLQIKQMSQQGMKKSVSAPSMINEPKTDKPYTMVVDDSNVSTIAELAIARAHIVKAEWFWTSVQNEGAADEKEFLFEEQLSLMSPSVASASTRRDSIQQLSTPTGTSSRRKRKRLAETLSSFVQNGTDSPASHKRRSSISDAGHLSVSGSFLDCTASPDKQLLDDIPEVEAVNPEPSRKLSPRHQVFLELLQTESNYVGILSTIMTLFKSPLEQLIETSGELLNSTEAKIIFGNFPPIYEVHKKMLEELRFCASHWSEDNSIGSIFLKYAPDLIKAYPPYVNFFENTKEMLDQCDQTKPRFHAFLKICQTKPECGRQSLKELLIKPVQRLPSISLLLNDILKHTKENNPDHIALEKSLSSIKEVMTYINEDKRKTEGQLAIFDIYQEIDNCPAHLVSSHRSFISKCDVQELSEGLSGRGDHLVLFLFTDMLEICKKRSKAFNSMKSPNNINGLHLLQKNQGKLYKHIKMLSLSTVKKVFDIQETEECRNVFALLVRSNEELKEKLYSFTISDEEVNKTNFLRTLCRQMANTVCKADADAFLASLEAKNLQIDTSDVALGTLSKAFKFANRTRMKVGRAFSFNKTPSKLKRAMSTMMSPFGSTTSLTPASQQLAQMRLASCNNINELGNGGSGSPSRDDVLVAPLSVQPTRKAKCSTLSIASLRRNCSEDILKDKSDI